MDVPYGSILAAILVCIGVGIFCGTCQVAMIETADMFGVTSDELKDRAQDFFGPMQISVYSVTGLMVFMSVLFVFVAFMATAQSKRQIYEDDTVPCGGRCCTTLALIIGYMLTFLWVVINGAIILPIIFTIMVSRYYNFLAQNSTANACIDLAYYGFTDTGGRGTTVCGTEDLNKFGSSADTAFLYYIVAYGGSVIVLLGLVNFLMCFSANWGHLKDGLKRRDYEKKRQQEEQELEEINAGYAHDNHPRAQHRNTGPAVMVPESYEMRVGRGGSGRGGGGGGIGGGGERPPINGYY
ncbi:neuronal membrane glycoprotein M6-a-like [Amphiura filiformis]|uniref:neuronal membrane glycoprotein M6-a-like n=1 Tax=Amphiura filiformis TaxID=82378 RepID=UPI003B21E016